MRRKNIKTAVKEYFFNNPTTKKRVREIERELKLPLPSVIRYCKELEEDKILRREIIGNVTFYTSNRGNKRFHIEKKLNNIIKIEDSRIIDHLRKELSNPPIILFGSYSRGEDTEESDIDIYVETPSKKEIKLEQFENILNRKIQLHKSKSIKKIKNHHLANNILNGITLNGQVEVFG